MAKNHEGTLENTGKESDMKVAVNSMQRTAYVKRMAIPEQTRLSRKEIVQYDLDNLYPNKAKSIAERSGSTKTAIGTLSSFITGSGFQDDNINKIEINEDKQTLFDILRHVSSEKAMFSGFAIHVQYNLLGQIAELNEISFELLRWNHDQTRIFWCKDWTKARFAGRNKNVIEYFPYDPERVGEQIGSLNEGEEFNGQVLYWVPRKKDIYTLCRFDAVMEDSQFQAESKLWKLSNVQNGYAAGYILFYPAQLESELEKKGLINDTKNASGSANAGKTKAVPLNASVMENSNIGNLVQEIPRTGVDKLFTKQNEEAKFDIYAIFQQPPILNGISKDGMFNQASFLDAFDYYNSFTETDRHEVERMFNKLLPFSIWGIQEVEIKPKQFIIHRETETETEKQDSNQGGEEDGKENNS